MIEIKNTSGAILYVSQANSNKEAVKEAINEGVSLISADFEYMDLRDMSFMGADIIGANFRHADLRGSYFREMDLRLTNFTKAILSFADLCTANLSDISFEGANLSYTSLQGVNLTGTYLMDANLSFANISGANLTEANLSGADLSNIIYSTSTIGFNLSCPSEGAFIGWKQAEGYIVKLLIPEDAKRSSATTRKCRCSKAVVLDIQHKDGTPMKKKNFVTSGYDSNFIYKMGETVEVKDFEEDRWKECAPGIHFFIDREDAVNY